MMELTIMSALQQMLLITLLTVCVITIPTLVVGVIVSIFQAATQINEMTITFIPKLIVMFVVLLTLMPWLMEQLILLMEGLMHQIPSYIR